MKSPFSECHPRWVHKSSHSRGPTSCHTQSASWCWKHVELDSSIKSRGGGGDRKDSSDLKSHGILSEEESGKKVNLFDFLPCQPFSKSRSSKCGRHCDKHREQLSVRWLPWSWWVYRCHCCVRLFVHKVSARFDVTEGLASVNAWNDSYIVRSVWFYHVIEPLVSVMNFTRLLWI